MTTTTEFERQTEKLWHQKQSWHYEALYRYGDFRLKVDIERNAYDFQSHLRVKVFDPVSLQWNVLVSDAMTKDRHCHKLSYVNKQPDIRCFQQDADQLLAEARLVLGE